MKTSVPNNATQPMISVHAYTCIFFFNSFSIFTKNKYNSIILVMMKTGCNLTNLNLCSEIQFVSINQQIVRNPETALYVVMKLD